MSFELSFCMWAKKYVFHCARASYGGRAWAMSQRAQKTETHSVDLVHALLALVTLTFDPVPVEIGEETVEVISACGVSIPFGCVIS